MFKKIALGILFSTILLTLYGCDTTNNQRSKESQAFIDKEYLEYTTNFNSCLNVDKKKACISSIVHSIEDEVVKACVQANVEKKTNWGEEYFESQDFAKDIEELFKECIAQKELKIYGQTKEEQLNNIPIFDDYINAAPGTYKSKSADENFDEFYVKYRDFYFTNAEKNQKVLEERLRKENPNYNSNNWNFFGTNNFWFYYWMLNSGRSFGYNGYNNYQSNDNQPNTANRWNTTNNGFSNLVGDTNSPTKNPTTDNKINTPSGNGGKNEIADSLFKAQQQKVSSSNKASTTTSSSKLYEAGTAGLIGGTVLGASSRNWGDTSSHYQSSSSKGNFWGHWSSSSYGRSNSYSSSSFGGWSGLS